MDLNHFLVDLLHSLSLLDFVEKVDLQTEVFILRGKAILTKNRFLQVYFNELTGTTALALIENSTRIWGVDYDNLRGWHLHPGEHPDAHKNISPQSVEEMIFALREVWQQLP